MAQVMGTSCGSTSGGTMCSTSKCWVSEPVRESRARYPDGGHAPDRWHAGTCPGLKDQRPGSSRYRAGRPRQSDRAGRGLQRGFDNLATDETPCQCHRPRAAAENKSRASGNKHLDTQLFEHVKRCLVDRFDPIVGENVIAGKDCAGCDSPLRGLWLGLRAPRPRLRRPLRSSSHRLAVGS